MIAMINSLKDRSILVTGGAGFIGSHLVDRLIQGNCVSVLDNFSSGKMKFIEHNLGDPRFTLIEGDLLDAEIIDSALDGIDLVFHLAANADVRVGPENTLVHLEENLLATYNLLEAMRKSSVRNIAFTSTSTVYGEATVVPTPESYGPLLPISIYGGTKLACEALISSFSHTFDMKSWIFRFANIVGERSGHGVLPDFIKKLRSNPEELEILGSGTQKKSYLGVRDCVDAMILCVERSADQVNIFNIGSDDWVDVTMIADIVAQKMGLSRVKYRYTGGIDGDGRGWKGDVRAMLLSTDAIARLGWRPRHGSRESIELAVEGLLREGG
jgi:UDP-glucose 4-epimerase